MLTSLSGRVLAKRIIRSPWLPVNRNFSTHLSHFHTIRIQFRADTFHVELVYYSCLFTTTYYYALYYAQESSHIELLYRLITVELTNNARLIEGAGFLLTSTRLHGSYECSLFKLKWSPWYYAWWHRLWAINYGP